MAQTASRAAAGALTRSLRRRVTVTVPEFAVSLVDQLPAVLGQGDRPLVAVVAHLLGDLSGPVIWVASASEARRLGGVLLARDPDAVPLDDLSVQAILIRGVHTVAGAYADVLGALTHSVAFLSVPDVVFGPIDLVLARSRGASDRRAAGQLAVCVASRIAVEGESVAALGHLVFLPHHPSFGRILRALGHG